MLDAGWHAEIFDLANQFASFKAKEGFVFVYDEPRCEKTFKDMAVWKGERGGLPVIFYSSDRVIEPVVRAMLIGAIDYLDWPIAPEKLDALTASIDEHTKCGVVKKKILIPGDPVSIYSFAA